MENPIKMDDLGIPDTAILGNLHMFMTCSCILCLASKRLFFTVTRMIPGTGFIPSFCTAFAHANSNVSSAVTGTVRL